MYFVAVDPIERKVFLYGFKAKSMRITEEGVEFEDAWLVYSNVEGVESGFSILEALLDKLSIIF